MSDLKRWAKIKTRGPHPYWHPAAVCRTLFSGFPNIQI
jgi:hypothetical protein